jgi:hypothetical protein
MKSSALMFCAGFVAAQCAVWQPSAAQVAGPSATPPTPACTFNASQVVVELASPASPAANPPANIVPFNAASYGDCDVPATKGGACDTPPEPSATNNVPPKALTDIQAAFNIAPGFFQKELCTLDHIYIDTDPNSINPLAWGIRERLHPSGTGSGQAKHIGLSATLWSILAASNKPPYETYENWVLGALLTPRPPNENQWLNGLTYSASPDPAPLDSTSTPNALAALGLLAHEMGHIWWWEKQVRDYACPADGSHFYQFSWGKSQVAHGFHRFGRADESNRTVYRPDNRDVADALRYGDHPYPIPARYLNSIYGGEWASLFASVSLDEDFVETHKLWVLTAPDTTNPNRHPLTSLSITIPNPAGSPNTPSTVDILSLLSNSNTKLYKKSQWIQNCNILP